MAFALRCPKCHGTDFEIRKDARSFGSVADSRVFSCRCGKQMFGMQIDQEYKLQEKSYVESPEEKSPLEALREHEKRREANKAAHRDWLRRKRVEEEEEKRKREEENRAHYLAAISTKDCAWEDCDKRQRGASKYCSRSCSNKNARARYKRRRKEKAA